MSASRPQFQEVRHRVETCIADFQVSAEDGPLASPDRILAALRQEILPALDQFLHSDQLADAYAQITALEIDLGDWPKDPDWPAVRAVFRDQLESALAPYLQWPTGAESPKEPIQAAETNGLESTEKPISFSTPRVSGQLASDQPDPRLKSVLSEPQATDLLRVVHGTRAQLSAYLDRALAESPETARAIFAGLFGDTTFRDALSTHHDPETLAHLRATMLVAHHDRDTLKTRPSATEHRHDPVDLETPASALLNRLFTDAERPEQKIARSALNKALQMPLIGPSTAADTEVSVQKSPTPDARRIGAVSTVLGSMPEATLSRLDTLLVEQPILSRATARPIDQDHDTSAPQDIPTSLNKVEQRNASTRIAEVLTLAGHFGRDAERLAAAISARYNAPVDAAKVEAAPVSEVADHRDNQHNTTQFSSEDRASIADGSTHRSPTLRTNVPVADPALRDFDGKAASPVNPATTAANPAKGEVRSNFKTTDNRRDQPSTPLIPGADQEPNADQPDNGAPTSPKDALTTPSETGAFTNWAAWLIDPATPVAEVRHYWQTNNVDLSAALAEASTEELSNLIAKLGPQNAPEFWDAVDMLRRTATYPKSGLTHLMRDLLDGQPLDITAALQAGERSDLAVASGTENGATLAHETAKPADQTNASSPSVGGQTSAPDLGVPHWAELLYAMGLDPATIAAAFGPIANLSLGGKAAAAQIATADRIVSTSANAGDTSNETAVDTSHQFKTRRQTAAQADTGQTALGKIKTEDNPQNVSAENPDHPLSNSELDADSDVPSTEVQHAEETSSQSNPSGQPPARAVTDQTLAGAFKSSPVPQNSDSEKSSSSINNIGLQENSNVLPTKAMPTPEPIIPISPSRPPSEPSESVQSFANDSKDAPDAQNVDPATPSQAENGIGSDPDSVIALAEIQPALEAIVQASTHRDRAGDMQNWRAALDLIWSALPDFALSFDAAPPPSQPTATLSQTNAVPTADGAETKSHSDLPATSDSFAERDPRYWKILLQQSIAPRQSEDSMSAFLDDALHEILPDPPQHETALRHLIARLSYTATPASRPLRVQTLEALQEIAEQHSAPPAPSKRPAVTAKDDWSSKAEPDDAVRLLTTRAGLVLFHPYLKLLFDRLELLNDDQSIRADCLLRACAALRHISDRATTDVRPADPLEKVLLGLPQDWSQPETVLSLAPDAELIDGLVKAVIDRWGALGQTSPDGLREAFVRRTGSLRMDENGAHLTVDPGPFDMLLDKLPWGFGTVALPWMDLPCHVDWRGATS